MRRPQTVGTFVGSSRLESLVSVCIGSRDYLVVPMSCKYTQAAPGALARSIREALPVVFGRPSWC